MSGESLTYKGFFIEVRRGRWRDDWYIQVMAPAGDMFYDGWWPDSAHRTVEEAIAEAKEGAQIDRWATDEATR